MDILSTVADRLAEGHFDYKTETGQDQYGPWKAFIVVSPEREAYLRIWLDDNVLHIAPAGRSGYPLGSDMLAITNPGHATILAVLEVSLGYLV